MEREIKILQIEEKKPCGLCLDREQIRFNSVVIVPAERDEEEVAEEIALRAQKLHIEKYHRN